MSEISQVCTHMHTILHYPEVNTGDVIERDVGKQLLVHANLDLCCGTWFTTAHHKYVVTGEICLSIYVIAI